MDNGRLTHLEEEISNQVEDKTNQEGIVSNHFCLDNTGVDRVCCDTYMHVKNRQTHTVNKMETKGHKM